MDDEHGPPPGIAPEPPAAGASEVASEQPPTGWVAVSRPKTPRRVHVQRIGVGALVSILFLVVAYGPSNVFMLLLLAVVCTVGVALIPLAFVCWIVGWVVLAAWRAFARRRQGASSAP
jgi:hypothetical protein